MSIKGIPKYVQTLQKLEVDDDELKHHLVKAYEVGGVLIDKDMARLNPNAKTRFPYVSVTSKVISDTKSEINKEEAKGEWVYCGRLWYVRNIGGVYEFARYMAYNTYKRAIEDLWDEEKYKKINQG